MFDTLEGRLETSVVEEGAREFKDHGGQVERKEGNRVNKREGETRVPSKFISGFRTADPSLRPICSTPSRNWSRVLEMATRAFDSARDLGSAESGSLWTRLAPAWHSANAKHDKDTKYMTYENTPGDPGSGINRSPNMRLQRRGTHRLSQQATAKSLRSQRQPHSQTSHESSH